MLEALIDRPEYERLAPGVVAALRALSQTVDASGLDKTLVEIVKVRASQLNGCAFCLQFHLNIARQLDVPAAKLDLIAVWREAPLYTPRERAALAWTEALTRMNQAPVDPAAEAALRAEFTLPEIAMLTAAIGAINAWNRIAGALRFGPPTAG
ncbi:MAG: carboxymuconolactone decarboxylase family protein [Pelomonas sp.]|nr:carboxymuconolactone decarboxylase family protein [Roseateles sp.]